MKIFYLLTCTALAVLAQEQETPALRELKSGNLKFSANAYKELAEQNPGKSILVCPLSVQTVLALTESGAGGTTAEQLITGLNLPDSEEKIHEAFKTIAPTLNHDEFYTLASANKIYIKNGFKLRPQFKEVATNVFNAEVDNIDFAKSEAAATEINGWVSKQTHDKIKDLISKNDLDELTRAVLINSLYFHGLWSKPFYNDSTTEKPFKLSSKKEVQVKMMAQKSHFNFHEDTELKAKFLEMNYDRSPISMTFVLPNDVDGLSALESKIDKVLEEPEFKYKEVRVQIPHIHVEQKIDFVSVLKKFKVQAPFDLKSANFSRLTENDEKVYISKIIQKTFIDVEEKGTTAAAATAVLLLLGSSGGYPTPEPEEFEANHPFIFIVRSRTSGILFVGRYIGPEN